MKCCNDHNIPTKSVILRQSLQLYHVLVTQFNDTQSLSVHFFCTIKETSKVCPTHGVECHGEFEDTQTSDSVSLGRVGEQPFLGLFR